jgi:hypothetical protein
MKSLLAAGAAALVLVGGAADAAVVFDAPGAYSWTVPTTGLYRVDVWGGQGGFGTNINGVRFLGGLGAEVAGDFQLVAGETLSILVGAEGENRGGQPFGGGGGDASAVFLFGEVVPLLMAGAGGGSPAFAILPSDVGGPGTAGLLGDMGRGAFGGPGGGAAGGLFQDGAAGAGGGAGLGGGGLASHGVGGQASVSGGGGGGGFSGGGGGSGGFGGGGGGGGSYVSLNARPGNVTALGGMRAGNGLVTIDAISLVGPGPGPGTAATVPEPGTWSLMILGFGLLGAGLRRRRAAPRAA